MNRIVFVLTAVVSVAALANEPLVRRLLTIDSPPTREALTAVGGPQTETRLHALAQKAGPAQLAALSALSYFPSPATLEVVLGLSTHQHEVVRKRALECLAFAFATDLRAEKTLVLSLDDVSPVVRRAAAWGLETHTSVAASTALMRRLAVETEPQTRDVLRGLVERGAPH